MSLKSDPKERDPRYRRLIRAAERQARVNLGGLAETFGGCHALWAEQQRILRDEHGIEWKSPADLNPGVIFD